MDEWLAPFFMAAALGMEALSMSLPVGMNGTRMREASTIALTVGLCHMIMPLIGAAFGQWMSMYFQQLALWIGGGLLVISGCQMVFSGWNRNNDVPIIRSL